MQQARSPARIYTPLPAYSSARTPKGQESMLVFFSPSCSHEDLTLSIVGKHSITQLEQ